MGVWDFFFGFNGGHFNTFFLFYFFRYGFKRVWSLCLHVWVLHKRCGRCGSESILIAFGVGHIFLYFIEIYSFGWGAYLFFFVLFSFYTIGFKPSFFSHNTWMRRNWILRKWDILCLNLEFKDENIHIHLRTTFCLHNNTFCTFVSLFF